MSECVTSNCVGKNCEYAKIPEFGVKYIYDCTCTEADRNLEHYVLVKDVETNQTIPIDSINTILRSIILRDNRHLSDKVDPETKLPLPANYIETLIIYTDSEKRSSHIVNIPEHGTVSFEDKGIILTNNFHIVPTYHLNNKIPRKITVMLDIINLNK